MDNQAWEDRKPNSGRVPGYFEKYSENSVTKATLATFDDLLSDLKTTIDSSESLVNSQVCPVEWLDYLAALSGYTDDYWRTDYPVSFKRAMITRANWIFSNKGSLEVLRYVLTSFGIENKIQIDSDFIIGLSKVGDRVGFLPYSFVIYINPRQENIETLKQNIPEFVRLYAPFWCVYKIVEDYNRFAFFAFLGFRANQNLLGIGSIDSESRKLLIETIGIEKSNNPIADFSASTLAYRNKMSAVGFNDDLTLFNAIDKLIVKPLEQSVSVSNIGLVSLFLGSTEAQQRINLYGNDYTDNGGEATSNGFRLDSENEDFLSSAITLPTDSTISLQIFEADLDDTGVTVYSTDNGNLVGSKISSTVTLINNGETYSYNEEGSNSFNLSTISQNLFINGFQVTKVTLASGNINGIKIGSNAGESIFFSGTIRYVVALRTPNISADNILLNFFNSVGLFIPDTISRYHPNVIEYRQTLLDSSSSITDTNLAALNGFIRSVYNAGLLENLVYAFPFCSTDENGIQAGFLADIELANNIVSSDYSIQNGLIFSGNNSKWLQLEETVSSANILSGSNTYLTACKLSNINRNDTGYYGCGNNAQRFGLFQSGNNSDFLSGFYGFSNFAVRGKVTLDREIVIAQHNVNTAAKLFQNGNVISTGIIQNGNMQPQKIRVGSVIIDNVPQTFQNTFQVRFFCKFVDLSDNNIVIVSELINQFNRNVNRA